jgi:hypothetical protein
MRLARDVAVQPHSRGSSGAAGPPHHCSRSPAPCPGAGDSPAPFLQGSGLAPTPSGLSQHQQQQLPAAAGTPTTLGAPQAVRTHSLTLGQQLPDLQPFWEYLAAEANPQEKVPTADVVWRQTERDRV